MVVFIATPLMNYIYWVEYCYILNMDERQNQTISIKFYLNENVWSVT